VRGLALTIGLGAVLAAGAGGAAGEPSAAPEARLALAVTPKHLRAHLVALAAIAKRNGGTRAVGTSGYSQSVAYVTRRLRAAGYRPRLNSFSFDLFRETKPPVFERVAPGARRYRKGRDFITMRYSGGGAVTAGVAPVDFTSTTSGCELTDFVGFPRGAVALMRRGGCFFSDKAHNAEASGASGVLIANDGGPGHTAPIAATLFGPAVHIPVLVVSSALGAELAQSAQPGTVQVRIVLSVVTRHERAANVIADLPGRKSGVVLLGGHLDSVAAGPGINDNGSGTALVLEVARQARHLHVRPTHGLRFAFWGAEELGLVGSTSYVQGLSATERAEILGVLNFDMVGSPNFGRMVYDGDRAPPGSVRIENAFRAYFAGRGLPVEEESLGGSSDHAAFARAGIPVGGLFTGADAVKPAALARRFGGSAGRPFDGCYHQACDTLANVNLGVLGQMADAAAVVALRLAG
jgi:peptidase M28-like protein/PA domain-containing protein